MRLGRGYGLQIRAARAADSFESTRDVDAFVELFSFEEAIVGRIEVFAFDVKACKRKTLPGGFFDLFMRRVDLAEGGVTSRALRSRLMARSTAWYFMKSSASSRAASTSLTCSVCESVSAIEGEFTTSHLRQEDTKTCGEGTFLRGKCALQMGKAIGMQPAR
jgi:hypothetical protein